MSTDGSTSRFEAVDWTEIQRSRTLVSPERLTFVVGLVVVFALYVYDSSTGIYLVGDIKVTRLDWVTLAGLVVIASLYGVPIAKRRNRTRRVLRRMLSRPKYVFGVVSLGLVALVGLLGPWLTSRSVFRFHHGYHAPVGFTGRMLWTGECLGTVTMAPDGFTRYCDGTWQYPLGTNHRGHPLSHLVVEGASVAMDVVVFTLAFIVPIAAFVGIVAGFWGGRVDDLLMGYVDIQLSIPALVAFIIGYMYWNVSVLLLLVTFGFLSWGGIARLVRSETLQRREDGYVLVARSLGASAPYIGRRHIIPNITNTLVPAVFHLLALFIIVEVGIAFLGFHAVDTYSWGSTIQEGIALPVDTGKSYIDPPASTAKLWWVSTFPATALTITIFALKLTGDALRDALDPRTNG